MQKSHKMKRICSLFRSIVYSIKEKLLSLRSEFHLRRKESLKFSRRQETSTFQSKKHYVKTRRPIAHTRYRGVGIGGIQRHTRVWTVVHEHSVPIIYHRASQFLILPLPNNQKSLSKILILKVFANSFLYFIFY